jgi:hypothetical protein
MRAIASAEARETTMLMGVVNCSGFYSVLAPVQFPVLCVV